MKNISIAFITLGLALVISSCNKQSASTLPQESITDSTEIFVDSCKSLSQNFTICFDSLLHESRCPYGVACVWSGYALARFKLSNGIQQYYFKLATDTFAGYKNDTTILGINLRLTDITPHPATTILYPYSAYKVKLVFKY